jgi:hypothetical protein
MPPEVQNLRREINYKKIAIAGHSAACAKEGRCRVFFWESPGRVRRLLGPELLPACSRRAKLNHFFICITRKAEKSCAPPPQRAATEKHRIQGSFPHCHRRRWHCGKRSLNLLDQQWRRGSLESQHHRVEEGVKSATSWRRRRRRRAGLRRQRMRGSAAQWETESESEQAS